MNKSQGNNLSRLTAILKTQLEESDRLETEIKNNLVELDYEA